jgi:hypothetical protein
VNACFDCGHKISAHSGEYPGWDRRCIGFDPVKQPGTGCSVEDCECRLWFGARMPVDLRLVRNPDGSQRFYPPYEHPAVARARSELARLREIELLHPAPPILDRPDDVERAIEWWETRIAVLELGEDRAKQAYIAHAQGQTA